MLRFSAFLLEQIEAKIAWVCLSSIRPRTAFSTGQNKRWPWFTFYALRVGEEGVVCTPHQRPTLILWHTCGQKYSLILCLFPFILVYLFLSFYSRIRLHSFMFMFSLFSNFRLYFYILSVARFLKLQWICFCRHQSFWVFWSQEISSSSAMALKFFDGAAPSTVLWSSAELQERKNIGMLIFDVFYV